MPFDATNLTLLSVGSASGNAPRLWAYTSSADAFGTIAAVNYFRAASGSGAVGGLRAGDVILARDLNGVVSVVGLTTVTTAASTGVKVTTTALA